VNGHAELRVALARHDLGTVCRVQRKALVERHGVRAARQGVAVFALGGDELLDVDSSARQRRNAEEALASETVDAVRVDLAVDSTPIPR